MAESSSSPPPPPAGGPPTTSTGQLRFSTLDKDLMILRGDVNEIRDEVAQIKEVLAGYNVRFDNGRKVMAELKTEIDKLKPRAPDWMKLLLAGFSIVAVLMGAQLWITNEFNDRPTHEFLRNRLEPIEHTQEELRGKLQDLAQIQARQTQSLETIEKSVQTLIERTEPTPTRKRRSP